MPSMDMDFSVLDETTLYALDNWGFFSFSELDYDVFKNFDLKKLYDVGEEYLFSFNSGRDYAHRNPFAGQTAESIKTLSAQDIERYMEPWIYEEQLAPDDNWSVDDTNANMKVCDGIIWDQESIAAWLENGFA